MKTAILGVLVLAATAGQASALVQTGFHLGLDRNGHDFYETTPDAELGEAEALTLFSRRIADPILGGVHLFADLLPFVDLEAGAEASYASYKYGYEGDDRVLHEQESGYGRLAVYASGKFHFISLPMFRLYVGGGAGYHLITPLFGEDLVRKDLESGGDTLDLADILGRRSHFGAHALGGLRLRPAILPFSLSLEGRYFMLPANEFGDDNNKFLSFILALDFGA